MAFQILFLPSLYWLAWIELALLLICAIAYRVSLHEAWHDKRRNDRRLAEGLRGALFRSLVMVDDEPVAVQSRYATCGGIQSQVENPLPFYSATQSWFIGTLKRIALQERRRFAATIDWTRDLSGIKQFLAKEWIQRQADYHAENADRHDRKVSRNTICRLVMIGLIILVAIVHAFGIGHDASSSRGGLDIRSRRSLDRLGDGRLTRVGRRSPRDWPPRKITSVWPNGPRAWFRC